MVVDHVVIVVFVKSGGDSEAVFGAENLLKKYQSRETGRPISCHLIHINPGLSLKRFQAGTFEKNKQYQYEENTREIDATVGASDNVGVYLIFHGSNASQPHIFEAQKSGRLAGHLEKHETGVAVATVLRLLGLKKVKKLCLLMCNGAVEDDGFVTHLCKGLKQELDSPPMIAGWDTFISLQMATGGHKIKNMGGDRSDASFKNEHKKVFVFKGGNYEKKTLVDSGWSDKTQLATNTSDVTII